ncbi:MAG: hypothetical protein GOU98_02640 [Candidatus Altiarchaeota archaeon]|nr:hypothetical protein [Candidatus Altiarchaeota archaeon]
MLSGYIEWANNKIKTLDIWDIKAIKLSVAAFTLMIAKLWTPILSLDWYWYAALGALAMSKPLMKVFK